MAAGKTFQEKLGDDYYPLHLGAYDRMILMVFYLESKYGKDWADPTTSTLNYDADQIAEGIDFIKSLVDGHVIMKMCIRDRNRPCHLSMNFWAGVRPIEGALLSFIRESSFYKDNLSCTAIVWTYFCQKNVIAVLRKRGIRP